MHAQAATTEATLEARNLVCCRNEFTLFEQLDLALNEGEILQIRGMNGSGKTSLIRILAGLSLPDSGEIFWQGKLIDKVRPEYCSNMVYVGHLPGVKRELTVLENLKMFHALSAGWSECDFVRVIKRVGLQDYHDTRVKKLSAGQSRRVALARLLIHPGTLWILDEPQASLDVEGMRLLEAMIREHVDNGGMLVITTHQELDLPKEKLRLIDLGEVN